MTTGRESLFIDIASIQRHLDAADAGRCLVNAEHEQQWGFARLGTAKPRRKLRDANDHIAALQRAAEQLVPDHQESSALSFPSHVLSVCSDKRSSSRCSPGFVSSGQFADRKSQLCAH